MSDHKDIFISYGRKESKAFATRLYERLTEEGYDVWFDQNDIPLSVKFQKEIDEGIARADNFIFIIAPHAVNSPYCLKEIELALRFEKRIIPILHIEEFGREVWQERIPTGTDADWEAFQQEGRHSSFPNMHPEIGERNWVYMRERCLPDTPIEAFPPIDDFESKFLELLSALQAHSDYVRQHTVLLNRALEWERNQKTSQYLLVGEERKAAERWMLRKFGKDQPPVIPSDLHCEYISDARKNGENRMTDVFICYATEDRTIRDKVILALSRYCVTTWTHDRDIQSGQTSWKAIRDGIEKADNVLFFISEHAVRSPNCLRELEHAVKHQKRIIPLRIEAVPEENVPEQVRRLQYIDFTNNVEESDFYEDVDGILRQLDIDKDYHERHKMLLVQALKWERQDKNPSILLRGHNLQKAQVWLKTGIQRSTHRPTALHQTFIEESATQSGNLQNVDIFISYSRTDSDFARRLNDRLQLSGKTTWFDQENIEEGVADFGEEIRKGIEQSDNFVFIISPDAVRSKYCADETDYARQLGKRIITIRWRPLPQDLSLPKALASIQWIDARKGFEPMYNLLIRALEVDRAHVEAHGRWQRKALEWSGGEVHLSDTTATDDSLLLRGSELESASRWLEENAEKQPPPTQLQHQFIAQSQRADRRDRKRKERVLDLAIVAFAVIIAAGVLAGTQLVRALQRGDRLASYNLLFEAQNLIATDSVKALQLAKTAYEIEKEKNGRVIQEFFSLAERYLKEKTGRNPQLFRRLPHEAPVVRAYFDEATGSNLVTLDAGNGLKLWSPRGELIRTLHPTGASTLELSNKNNFEKIDALYSESVKRSGDVVWYGSQRLSAHLPDDKGSHLWLWDGKGNVLFEKRSPHPIELLNFASDTETRQLLLAALVREAKGDYRWYHFNEAGDTVRFEQGYAPTNSRDTLFSPSGYRRDPFQRSDMYLSFLSNGESFRLTYKRAAEPDSTSFLDRQESLEEQFSIVGLPLFWSERMMVLTENGVLLWKPYHMFRAELERELGSLKKLTPAEKVQYDIASIFEALQVDYEASYQLAKVVFFLLLFFLSILLLDMLYRMFLAHRYLDVVLYALNFVIVAFCWSQFLVYRGLFIAVAFSYGLILSGGGAYLTWVRRKENDLLKISLRMAALILLAGLSLASLYFGRMEYLGNNETLRTQSLSLVLYLGLVKAALFATTFYWLRRFYKKRYRYLPDLTTAWVFLALLFLTVSYFYGPSDVSEKEDALGFFLLVFMPLLYVFRFNANQFMIARLEKKRSSRRVLRFSVIGFAAVLLTFLTGIFVESVLITSAVFFLLYLFIEYVASFVVAIVQKDRFSLLGNIASTISLITILSLWGSGSITRHEVIRIFPPVLLVLLAAGLGYALWQRRRQQAAAALVEEE